MKLAEFVKNNSQLGNGTISEVKLKSTCEIKTDAIDGHSAIMVDDFTFKGGDFEGLVSHLGIPKPYANRMPSALMIPHLKHLLTLKDTSVYVNESGQVLAVHSPDQPTINPKDIAMLPQNVIGSNIEDLEIMSYSSVTGAEVLLYVVDKKFQFEPKVGDPINVGLVVNANYITGNVSSAMFSERLACLNGAVTTKTDLAYARDLKLPYETYVGDLSLNYKNSADRMIEMVEQMAQTKLPTDPTTYMSEISKMSGIGLRELGGIVNDYGELTESDHTVYDLWNVATSRATRAEYANPYKRFGAMSKAGNMIPAASQLVSDACVSCSKRRN